MDALAPPRIPQNVEVEQALLGAILVNNEAYQRVAPFLRPEHFYDPVHQGLFDLVGKRIAGGHVADPRTIKSFLGAQDIGEVSAAEYLERLANAAAPTRAVDDYGGTVLELAVRRQILAAGQDAETMALETPPDVPTGKLLEEVEGRFAEIRRGAAVAGYDMNLAGAAQRAVDGAGEAYRRGKPVGWEWCLPELETVVDGPVEPGNLYGLLGASGDGKSSLVLQQLRFLAEQGVPCLFLSGEQSPEQCIYQMSGQRLGIEASRTKKGHIAEAEFELFYEDAKALAKLPLAVQKWSDATVAKLALRVRAFVKRYGPGVVAIDHAKKIAWANPRGNFAEEVFQVYGAVKDLMADTGCGGILLMQRSSEFLKRRRMRPVRADVYGGEGPLQNLDACFGLYRPDKWLRYRAEIEDQAKLKETFEAEADRNEGVAEFYGLKSRFGEDDRRQRLRFVARFTRFESMREQEARLV